MGSFNQPPCFAYQIFSTKTWWEGKQRITNGREDSQKERDGKKSDKQEEETDSDSHCEIYRKAVKKKRCNMIDGFIYRQTGKKTARETLSDVYTGAGMHVARVWQESIEQPSGLPLWARQTGDWNKINHTAWCSHCPASPAQKSTRFNVEFWLDNAPVSACVRECSFACAFACMFAFAFVVAFACGVACVCVPFFK